MNHQRKLIRFSCLLLAALVNPVLAQQACQIGAPLCPCPLQQGQIEWVTHRWDIKGHVIYAAAGTTDQIEKQKLYKCTITPRTSNSMKLYNRNWYLLKCGDHQLVRVDTYIGCEESMNRVHNRLAGSDFEQRLNQRFNDLACSIIPVVTSETWFFRDKKGIDFPLSKNDNLLSNIKRGYWSDVICEKDWKWVGIDYAYEVGGVTSRKAAKYIVVIRKYNVSEVIPILERAPSL